MKLYPNQWHLPFWKVVQLPFAGEGKYLQMVIKGPTTPPEHLIHVETGKHLLVKNIETQDQGFVITAKGLTLNQFRPGDRLLSYGYPARWELEGLFIPQGAMNQLWQGQRATLMGSLVRQGGIPVEVQPREGTKGKWTYLLKCKGVLLLPGAFYWLEHANQRLDLTLLAPGPFQEKDLAILGQKAFRFPGLLSIRGIYSILLRQKGWVVLPPELYQETFEDALGDNSIRIMKRTNDFWQNKLLRRCKLPKGLSPQECEREWGLPHPVTNFLLAELVQKNLLEEKAGRYHARLNSEKRLSLYARTILKRLVERGELGLKKESLKDDLQVRGLEELCDLGLAVALDDGWFLSSEVIEGIVQKLTATNKRVWKISDLREYLDASRSYLLALLLELEKRGVLKREGNECHLR